MLMRRTQKRGNSPEWLGVMRLLEGMALHVGARRISLRQERHLFHGTGWKMNPGLGLEVWGQDFPLILVTWVANLDSPEQLSTLCGFPSIHCCKSCKKEEDIFPLHHWLYWHTTEKIISFQNNWDQPSHCSLYWACFLPKLGNSMVKWYSPKIIMADTGWGK